MKAPKRTLVTLLTAVLMHAFSLSAQTFNTAVPVSTNVPTPGEPSYVLRRHASAVTAKPAAAVQRVATPKQQPPRKPAATRAPVLVRVPEVSADGSWGPVNYAYDGIGNITGIGSNYYVYDGVSRLTKASTNSVVQTFSYDRFGNIAGVTSSNDSPLTLTVESTSNRLQSVTKLMATKYFSYDQLGDLTFDGDTTYSYDALGTMTGAHLDQYLYDADDERVATLGADGVSRYTLRGLDQKVLREIVDDSVHAKRWNWSKDYVYRGSQLLAEAVPAAGSEVHRHYHVDHLGSPRMITDESLPPLRLAYHDYYPFGGDTSDSTADQERLRFTGHERDLNTVNATTLDYMHARYYAGMWGRFLTTDAHAAAPSRPQSWNRYFYAHGNPVSFRDPDGNLEVISYYIGYNDASDKPYNYEVAYANRWSLGRDKFEPKAVAQVDHTFQRETPDINYGTLVMKGVAYVGKATRGVAATDASHLSGVSAFSGPLGKYNLAVFEGKIQDTFASYAVPLGGTPKSEIYLGWMPEISTRWSYSAEQVSRLQAAVDNVLKQYVDANKLTSDEAAKVRAEYDIQRLVDEANAKASGTMSSQYFTTGQGH